MTTTTIEVLTTRTPAMPRGARVAADLVARFAGWLKIPTAPRAVSRSQQAASVREMAYRVQHTDPGFAADLFAAAARHEALED